jgi:hypothetical protein
VENSLECQKCIRILGKLGIKYLRSSLFSFVGEKKKYKKKKKTTSTGAAQWRGKTVTLRLQHFL